MAEQADKDKAQPAARKPRRKPAGKKPAAKRKRGPGRPHYDPATGADFDALEAQLAKAAKAAAQGKGPTAAERVERDMLIVAAKALGLRPATIARKVGLSPAQVTRILAAHHERRIAEPLDGVVILRDALETIEYTIERLGLLIQNTKNEGVKLGAEKQKAEAERSRLELLLAMGVIRPVPADHFAEETIARRVAAAVAALVDAGVEDDVIRRMEEAMLGSPAAIEALAGRAS